METKEEDYVIRTFATRTHDNVLFFTSLGRVYRLKAYELPEGSRHSKGKAVINLLPRLKDHERVQTLLPVRDLAGPGALLFATRRGLVKRTDLTEFQNIRVSGIYAINLEEGDELVDVVLTANEADEVILATQAGQLVRFRLADVRPMGRATFGVIGVRLSAERSDRVVTLALVRPDLPELLSLTSTGFGKRTPVDEYRKTARGAHGVRTIRAGGRNGQVVAVLPVRGASEVLITTQRGITIRLSVAGIRSQSRNTLGVRIIRLDEGDTVRDALVLPGAIDVNGEPELDPETPPGVPPSPGTGGEIPPEVGEAEEAEEEPEELAEGDSTDGESVGERDDEGEAPPKG
jgi:DNA gyrase subunit A